MRDRPFLNQGIDVARHDLENAIELELRFRETAQGDVELGLPGEQAHVARIEPRGLVKIRLGFLPLSLAPGDKGERLRHPAAIGQELARLLVKLHRVLKIAQATVVIKTHGDQSLA